MSFAIFAALFVTMVAAQDPAPGWLAYATAQCPPGTKITYMEATWNVGQNPTPSDAFFSPWFGIDTSDNLNLLQPVNPWLGSAWEMYTEYYQWSPSKNSNSHQYGVNAGDSLLGQITYNGDSKQSYTLSQNDKASGRNSTQTIGVQQKGGQYKNYTIMYVVYEKVADCSEYPPEGRVDFNNIIVVCSGKHIKPQWTFGTVENVCNFQASSSNYDQVSITWDTQSTKRPTKEQIARSRQSGLKPRRP
eukprot:PhF_6_TR25827/c0_g1_i1/m.36472